MKESELSKKIWELKCKGENYTIEWDIRGQSKSYKPGSKSCKLCHEEVFQILHYKENENLVNNRNELYKKCRHKEKFKLIAHKD